MSTQFNITDVETITAAITLTGASLLPEIAKLPGVQGTPGAYEAIVLAGQMAYAQAYQYVYLVSIAFGGELLSCPSGPRVW